MRALVFVRPLRADEAEAAAAIIRSAFAAQLIATDPPPSAQRETGAGIATALARGGGLVALGRDVPVGALLWEPRRDARYLSRLSVIPDWRGRGVARMLLRRAEQDARTAGVVRLMLSTRIALLSNRRLFAAAGFVETSREAHPGYAAPTFVNLEKDLVATGLDGAASSR